MEDEIAKESHCFELSSTSELDLRMTERETELLLEEGEDNLDKFPRQALEHMLREERQRVGELRILLAEERAQRVNSAAGNPKIPGPHTSCYGPKSNEGFSEEGLLNLSFMSASFTIDTSFWNA
jgi:hypothetical protein